MPRIFVAIPVPAAVAERLDVLLPPLPGLRRVAPELMHVTLAFIGQVDEERLRDIFEAVAVAAQTHGPFGVELAGVGRFPQGGRPRTVWVGTAPPAADAIVRLGAAVRAELLRHRVQFDPKPLRGHVTLARVRDDATDDDAGAIAVAVDRARSAEQLAFTAVAVHVMESKLSAKGPMYSSRQEVPLAGLPGRTVR